MPNKPITMLQIRRIIQLLNENRSKREIARMLRCGRHTIDGYVNKIQLAKLSLDELLKLSDANLANIFYKETTSLPDERFEYISNKLANYQKELTRVGVTRHRLWMEYKEEVPSGYGYVQFCEHLKVYKRVNEATMHFDHKPGLKVQIDFAGSPLHYIDVSTGELVKCPVLVCVLPYSSHTYVEALVNASQEHLFAALSRCMSYYGGVPQNVLSDNMKQYVEKSNRYEPIFSAICMQWSLHYNTTLSAARVRKPKDKPSVENMVNVTYNRVYASIRNMTFYNLRDLNQEILYWLDKHNRTPFQRHAYSRLERFTQEELPLLKSLPSEPFIIKHTTTARVQKNYHVTLGEDYHHYSVLFQYIGKKVKIIYDTDEVEIYLGLKRIAIHKRDYKKHGYTTLPEHMPPKHQSYQESLGWDADYFLNKARDIGEGSYEVTKRVLESRNYIEQTYRACIGLMRLTNQYGSERYENACKRALQAPRVNYTVIHNILKNGMDNHYDEIFTEVTNIEHMNIRGPQAYH